MSEVKCYRNTVMDYEVEAIQFDATKKNRETIGKWVESKKPKEGQEKLQKSDWLIYSLEDDREFIRIPNEEFVQTYEEIKI